MMSKELIELIETIMLSDGDENMAPKKKNLIFVTIPSVSSIERCKEKNNGAGERWIKVNIFV